MVGNGGYHHTALYKSNKLFDSENKVGHTLQTCSIEESVDIYKKEYELIRAIKTLFDKVSHNFIGQTITENE